MTDTTIYGVRDEYGTLFGRQILTVWSGSFYSVFEGTALALPKNTGFMVTTYNDEKVRVSCPAPRTSENYLAVDDAIQAALREHYESAMIL